MKNNLIKKLLVFISPLLLLMIHLPFVFAKTAHAHSSGKPVSPFVSERKVENAASGHTGYQLVYEQLNLQTLGLSEDAFNYALKGFDRLVEKGKLTKDDLLSIVDFTKPSSQKRLFVIDLKNSRVLFNTYVAHGQGSGEKFARHFSNIPESYQSSLGFYITSDTYVGKNGYSMYLSGMEKGINDKAESRAIVMHGAPYVHESFIRSQGYIGRSWGCPAVPEKLNRPIIETIKGGSCLFLYSNNKKYLSRSNILNS